MKRFAIACALACVSLGAPAQDLAMKDDAGTRWACGGAGAEERAILASMRPNANLELLFVTDKRGGYLADIDVTLARADGAAPALKFVSDGPICMMLVPAGRYRITASFHGVTRTQRAQASGANGRPARVVFAFPGEPWDGIWASEEEKQSVRTQ